MARTTAGQAQGGGKCTGRSSLLPRRWRRWLTPWRRRWWLTGRSIAVVGRNPVLGSFPRGVHSLPHFCGGGGGGGGVLGGGGGGLRGGVKLFFSESVWVGGTDLLIVFSPEARFWYANTHHDSKPRNKEMTHRKLHQSFTDDQQFLERLIFGFSSASAPIFISNIQAF